MWSWVVCKVVKIKINVRLSAEICVPQRLSTRNEHALHFVQNLLIPKSVARHFDRYGICMKYQRRRYKICGRVLCIKLLKLKINVTLLAEIHLPQRLSVGEKHVLHFVQNLLIPKSVARHFDRYGIYTKYQRRWYKICSCGLCGKLCETGLKTAYFPFFGPYLWCWFLVLEVCFAFECDFFVGKSFQLFLHCFPVHCSEKYCFFSNPWQLENFLANLASRFVCCMRKCGELHLNDVFLSWNLILFCNNRVATLTVTLVWYEAQTSILIHWLYLPWYRSMKLYIAMKWKQQPGIIWPSNVERCKNPVRWQGHLEWESNSRLSPCLGALH